MKKNTFTERAEKHFFDNRFLYLSALCSGAIMLVVFMCFGLFPFGGKTILRMDLYHQYGPLFSELYDRVTSGGSLIYSFNTGLGGSFLGNYFNYLSSPIGFLVILIAGHKNMPEAIAVMVLIKCALSAFSLSYYLKKSQHRTNYVSAGFGVLYSLCGWFIAYYWNIMWIDALILLPLVSLGIEKIINNGKPALYITALAMTMFTNYYMSLMMCLFSVLYFLTYYISNYSFLDKLPYTKTKRNGKEKKYRRFFRSGTLFAFSSFAAAGLMAFMLIPTYLTLQQTSATSSTFPQSSSFYFSVFDFLSNHLASVTPTIRSSGDDVMPNVYCGIITLVLVPLYLLTKSISKKEKAAHIILLGIFLISFNLNTLNYIWHGLHFPNDLPYRQSFMYSFVLIVIAFKTFSRLNEIPNRYILFSSCGVILLSVMAEELKSKNVTTVTLFVSIIFAAIYALILVTLKDKKFQTVSVSVLLLCCICSEAIIADTSNFSMDQPKSAYAGDLDSFIQAKNYIDSQNDEPFYRMEKTSLRARMDPSWYNYNGVSTFSSMAYENVAKVQKSLGMHGNRINSYTYNPQTAVYNSMFSLKYIADNTAFNYYTDSKYMTNIYNNDSFKVYENNHLLPIGYCVDTAVSNWNTSSSDPFDVQNDLFEKATGISDVFVRTFPETISYSNIKNFYLPNENQIFTYERIDNTQNGKVTFEFVSEADSEVCIFAQTTDETNEVMTITTENRTISETLNKNYSYLLNIGQLKKGEKYSCSVPLNEDSGTIYLYVCYLDNDAFEEGYTKMKSGSIIYDSFSETEISGTFYAPDNTNVFMTSIPYDDGWSVYIDGEKMHGNNIVVIGDAFLGVYVPKGEHSIRLKYVPDGLYSGIAVTVISAAVLILIILISAFRRKKYEKTGYYNKPDSSFDTDVFITAAAPVFIELKSKSSVKHKELVKLEIIGPFDMNEEDVETGNNEI